MASVILAFSWATQLSRSAAEVALKVCLWPLAVKWNLLLPSVTGSEASACGRETTLASQIMRLRIRLCLPTYQLNGAMGSSLVRLLAVEQETLSSLGGPRSDVMGNIDDLVGLEGGGGLGVDGLLSEPEELLGVDQVPTRKRVNRLVCAVWARWPCHADSEIEGELLTWGSWHPVPCARGCPPQRA